MGIAPIIYATQLYRPIFDRLGVPAVLTIGGLAYSRMADGSPLTVLDKSAGLALREGDVALETVTPVAEFIVADLTGIGLTTDQLDGATVAFNNQTWNILSHRFNPSHNGISDGTVFCELEGATVDD